MKTGKSDYATQSETEAEILGDEESENRGFQLTKTNADFMTTIAGALFDSLNTEVILQFAKAVRQRMEEEREAREEAERLADMSNAAGGDGVAPDVNKILLAQRDEKKEKEVQGLILLNEVQEYITKCTFVVVHNSMCSRSDFADNIAAHKVNLPILKANDSAMNRPPIAKR
jgi:hypothetical protein